MRTFGDILPVQDIYRPDALHAPGSVTALKGDFLEYSKYRVCRYLAAGFKSLVLLKQKY